MFELELLELLNQSKRTTDNYKLEKIKDSISKLITEHKEEYDKFINSQTIDEQTNQFLKEAQNKANTEKLEAQQKATDTNNDFENIKLAYKKWLLEYNNNSKQVNENCENIINDIINFYIKSRFHILEEILTITDTEDFESFKNHLKNKIRTYFLEKIKSYMQTENYQKMFFFKKLRKKNEINSLITELSNYKFNPKKIEEVLK